MAEDPHHKGELAPQSNEVLALARELHDHAEVRREELALEHRQADLREKELAANVEYAKEYLQVWAGDLAGQRAHETRFWTRKALTALVAAVLLGAFLTYCLATNNQDFARTVLDVLIGLFTGGLGGYWFGRTRAGASAGPSDAA